jgi:hypothetical protein
MIHPLQNARQSFMTERKSTSIRSVAEDTNQKRTIEKTMMDQNDLAVVMAQRMERQRGSVLSTDPDEALAIALLSKELQASRDERERERQRQEESE